MCARGVSRGRNIASRRVPRREPVATPRHLRGVCHRFPDENWAEAIRAYQRPYGNPIAARAGEAVLPDPARSTTTDFLGWLSCRAADEHEG
jgi:hypothetical protein